MPEDDVTRRGFLTAGAAGAAGALLVGRSDARDRDDKAFVALPLTEYRELQKVGGWTDAELLDGTEVVVARVSEERYVCLSRKCTHANCNVEYDHRNKRIACPCHKSTYGLDGKPTGGPARRPLEVFGCQLAVVIKREK